MAKSIYVSDDDGTTWGLLPGSTGALNRGAGSIEDTVFGQQYQSHESGLITWTVNGQAIQKGQAGYKAMLRKAGTATAMTAEAMTVDPGNAKKYNVTNKAHSYWDRLTPVTVKDGGTAIAATNVKSVDYLFGSVTFISSFNPVGAVTVDGKFMPTVDLCGAQSFSLKQTSTPLVTTDFCAAQTNGGYAVNEYGLKIVSLDLSAIYDITYGFETDLLNRTEFIIEISPDGLGFAGGGSVARGYFKLVTDNQSGNVGALEINALTFELNVPVEPGNIGQPFSWYHGPNTMLSPPTIKVLDAWEQSNHIMVAYSPYGNEGSQGDSIVSDATMNSSMTTMCEFTCTFTGSGALTAYTTPIVPSGLAAEPAEEEAKAA